MLFTKILCPVDLSDFSKRAFEHGLVLGKLYGAEVVALHVFGTWIGNESTYPAWFRQVPQAREQIDRELRALLDPAKSAGMDVPLVVHEGDPASEILEQAADMRADLIVLSTHGRSGFDRLAIGSVTEKVLRKAGCPVLVVPVQPIPAQAEPAPPAAFAGYRRILCAIDFSQSSRQALKFAVSVARHGGTGVTLVHVVEIADNPDVTIDDASPLAALRRERVEAARESLRRIIAEHEDEVAAMDEVVRLGRSHQAILDVAAEREADLVVMGVRGRGAVDITLFGSTTNQVVRRAKCAVLTVRTR
ncbi:MAG TPA: universal stress protein [Vicinamibacterales bacterium]|nr:universal stress protein [Vicinamibacterales bacterium]